MRYFPSNARHLSAFLLVALMALGARGAGAGTISIVDPVAVDLRDSAPLLEESVKASPKDAGLRLALGCIYIDIGYQDPKRSSGPGYDPPEFALAERHLDKALELKPGMYLAHYYLGLLAVHRQEPEKALEHLAEAARLNPRDIRVHRKIHSVLFATRQYLDAAYSLRSALEVFPKEPELLQRLTITYMALEDYASARNSAREALAIRYDPETSNMLGTIELRQGSYLVAESEFRKVLKQFPENVNAMLGLGRTYLATGKTGKAREWTSRALAIEPGNLEAEQLLKSISGGPEGAGR